jgi:hypothetical protein
VGCRAAVGGDGSLTCWYGPFREQACARPSSPRSGNTRPRLDRCPAHRIRPQRSHRPRSRPVFGPPLRQLASDPSVPVEGGSCNDYEYVCGDPVNSQDVSGLCLRHISQDSDLWIIANGQDTYCGLYTPEIRNGKAGRVAVNPSGDGCSAKGAITVVLGPSGARNALRSFSDVCGAHDYLYDVLRAEAAKGRVVHGRRAYADRIFFTLAGRVCRNTGYIGSFNKASCQVSRGVFRAGLATATWWEGDPPR